MKKIAIISKYHPEASLCLAIHLAKIGFYVDFYTIVTWSQSDFPGFEFPTAPHRLGITKLQRSHIPEIYKMSKDYPVNFHLIRTMTRGRKTRWIDTFIIKRSINKIKTKQYDAINIIGQTVFVDIIHKSLANENIIHTYHEIGSHYKNVPSSPHVDISIKDGSKVILPSQTTFCRFMSLPHSSKCQVSKIPLGKLETLLAYEKPINMEIPLDLVKTTFLFYGRLVDYKGLSILKEAVMILNDDFDKFNVIIAGSGYDEAVPFFQSLDNAMVINRHLSNNEMMYLNRICSVVVMPYLSASQSGIVLTSFMVGKPIIATKVGALTEVIEDHENGLLVEKENPQAFANAMRQVIDNPLLLEELSDGAKKFGHGDQYDWDNIAQKTVDFYFS